MFKGRYFFITAINGVLLLKKCIFYCLAAVRVKWGKEKFEGVEVDTDEPPEVFKMQLFSLSGWIVLCARFIPYIGVYLVAIHNRGTS